MPQITKEEIEKICELQTKGALEAEQIKCILMLIISSEYKISEETLPALYILKEKIDSVAEKFDTTEVMMPKIL